jgi:hypothetical protein
MLAILLACARPSVEPLTSPPEPIAPTEPATAPATHPGSILFVDLDAETEEPRSADAVPESIAWAQVDGQRVPVVRIESGMRGSSREIKRYGPDGELLEVLISAPHR